MPRYLRITIALLASLVTGGALMVSSNAFGATILTTNSSDTFDTFRTNVNTSLTNLNAAIVGAAGITSIGPTGQGQTGSTITLASSTSSFNGLTVGTTIVGSGNTIIWTPSLSGTLNLAGGGTATTTFYSGGVVFSNGTRLTQSSAAANLFWDETNARLGIGSSTPLARLSIGTAGSDFYVTSAGKVVGNDTTNAWPGRLSPTRSFGLGTGTTTSWTASTTATAYSPYLVMPFSGTLRQVYCLTDTSFLGVNVQVNGSNATPSYFVASTTAGNIGFTAGNTFTKGQKILANFGTTTTSLASSVNCTFDVTETP